jgi:hypothetical protein
MQKCFRLDGSGIDGAAKGLQSRRRGKESVFLHRGEDAMGARDSAKDQSCSTGQIPVKRFLGGEVPQTRIKDDNEK